MHHTNGKRHSPILPSQHLRGYVLVLHSYSHPGIHDLAALQVNYTT